jgi:pimeloyl-ACP methyl ester carboxylesterase
MSVSSARVVAARVVLVALAVIAVAGAPAATTACAPPPATAVAPDAPVGSTSPGPWVVHRRAIGDGHELYVPSTTTAAPDRALFPLPLVVFTPGFSAVPNDYEATLLHLASHGFVVVGARHGFDFLSASACTTQRDGFERARAALNEVRLASRRPVERSDLHGLLDERAPVGAVGHSYGGKLALWLAVDDNGVGAVVALDPVDGGDERRPGWCADDPAGFPRIVPQLGDEDLPPTLVFTAGLAGECAPADGNGDVVFASLANDAVHLRLPRAAHTDFVDAAADEDCSVCGLCPDSEEDGAAVLRLVRGATVSFLRHRLLGDASEARWRTAGDIIDGSVDVDVQLLP